MSFKLGDRVRIKKDSIYFIGVSYNPIGVNGTVITLRIDHIHEYEVLWDNGESNAYREIDLEYVKKANTKITRKMYPNYKEDGDWLIPC